MNEKKRKAIESLIRISAFLLLFLMPVIFSSRFVLDAFGIPKVTVLRFFAPLIFLFWSLKKLISKETVKISAITYFAAAFVFTVGIATVFSKDFFVSFLGLCSYYEWGFTGVFAGFLIFIVVSDEFRTDDWTASGIVVLAAASVVSIYGIAQMLGFDPFYKTAYSFNRIFSTLGNPNFLGGYLVTVIPIALAFYLGSPVEYVPYIFILNIILAVNLGLTLSRASWLAFGVSVVLFALILGAENRRRGMKRLLVLSVSFMVVVFIFLVNRKDLESLQQPSSKSLVAQRTETLIDSGEASASARLETWKSAVKMFEDNFWHGVGPNLFQDIFPKYMTLKFAQLTGGKNVSNYAHNTILQVASTMGIFALAAYLTLWLNVLFFGFKRAPGAERLYFAGVVSSLFALFIFLQFHFFLNETMVYFWAMAGFVSSCGAVREIKLGAVKRYLLLGSSLVFILFYFVLAGRHLLADIHFMKGTDDYELSVSLMPRSLAYTRSRIVRQRSLALKNNDKDYLCQAEKLALRNVKFHMENPWAWSDLGAVKMSMVQFGNENKRDEAEECFIRAYKAGPYLYKNVLDLSMFYRLKGDMKSAEKYAALAGRIKKGGEGEK
ncbi:MAG: O-antigen ligase family protein [bacterium]